MGKLIDEEFANELIADCNKIIETLKGNAPKKKDFEDFLQDKFILQNPSVLDDDIPDAFADWIADIDPNDLIAYANEWGK